MLLVGLARGPEGAEGAAVDGGDVGGAEAERRAELVVRLGVPRVRFDSRAGERQARGRCASWNARPSPAEAASAGISASVTRPR